MKRIINHYSNELDMAVDVTIIGTGLGGLVTGAKLAKEGKKVLLLEQHSVPGGYATCFTQENFTIDVGLHSMDGLYERDPKIQIFEDLDVYFNVEFEKITTGYYRFTNGRLDFTIPDKREDAIQVLIEQFPEEKKGIIRFFNEIELVTTHTHKIPRNKALQAVIGPLVPILYSSIPKWGGKTAGDMLDKYFKNEDLKLVLIGTIQYYADDPYKLSAVIFSIALSSHFKGGNHYIKGGSMKLSNHLVNFIKDNGGIVLTNHKATGILFDDGKVCGVEYVPTTDVTSNPIQIFTKIVVANASIPHIVNDLIPAEEGKKLRDKVVNMKVGHSTLNLYFGFNTLLKQLGHKDYTTIVNDESVFKLDNVFPNNYGDYRKRAYLFVDYGQIDSGMAPSGKSTGTISLIDNIEDWFYLDEEQYKNRKKEVVSIFIERLNKLIPNVKNHIEYVSVATPKTKMRYTHNPRGTSIGFAQTISQAGMRRIKSKSPIPNLYFASAWTFPGGGFSSTIWSGWQCAIDLLNKLK